MAVEMVIIASAIVAFLFAYLATHLEKKHPALQFFFLVMSEAVVISTFAMASGLATNAGNMAIVDLMNRMYWFSILIMIVTIFYYMINIIKEILESFRVKA